MNAMYKAQSIDTSVEADRFVFKLLRQKSNSDRLAMSARAQQRGERTFAHGPKTDIQRAKPQQLC